MKERFSSKAPENKDKNSRNECFKSIVSSSLRKVREGEFDPKTNTQSIYLRNPKTEGVYKITDMNAEITPEGVVSVSDLNRGLYVSGVQNLEGRNAAVRLQLPRKEELVNDNNTASFIGLKESAILGVVNDLENSEVISRDAYYEELKKDGFNVMDVKTIQKGQESSSVASRIRLR